MVKVDGEMAEDEDQVVKTKEVGDAQEEEVKEEAAAQEAQKAVDDSE